MIDFIDMQNGEHSRQVVRTLGKYPGKDDAKTSVSDFTSFSFIQITCKIMREVRQFDADKLLVVAARGMVDSLLDEDLSGVAELEASLGRPIIFQVEPLDTREQFDIVLL